MPVLGDYSCVAWPVGANRGGLVVSPVGNEWVVRSPAPGSSHLRDCYLDPPQLLPELLLSLLGYK